MRRPLPLATLFAMLLAAPAPAAAVAACQGSVGTTRIVEIDTSGGPIFGALTKRAKEARFLAPKEVVITFDDGPLPWITRSILDTLDRHCAKATFFEVGRMAIAYPNVTREILARGHTIGGHTWSHPLNLPRLKLAKAEEEIEKGLAAVSLAAGQPVAPFFRFTGLSDSDRLLAFLQSRGVASFTVDVVSDDSYISDAGKLARVTVERVEQQQGGIILFHDIKASTARALPTILAELSKRGYRIVHLRARSKLAPLTTWDQELAPQVAKALAAAKEHKLLPFYGAVGPDKVAPEPQVTELAPAARPRVVAAAHAEAADGAERGKRPRPPRARMPSSGADTGGWSTEVVRPERKRLDQ